LHILTLQAPRATAPAAPQRTTRSVCLALARPKRRLNEAATGRGWDPEARRPGHALRAAHLPVRHLPPSAAGSGFRW